MQEQYPSAQIVTGGDVDDSEGQFLVISAISPHRELSHHVFQRARSFSVSSRRNTTGPVAEHFAEKVVYTTADPFPTILRRSEVVGAYEVKLSAWETGLERIVRKTQEMTIIEKRIAEGDDENAQLLLDAVGVSVNPNSENSVVCYRQLLPEPEDDEDIELSPQDNAIRMALVDHAIMIKRCLGTFSRSSNDMLRRRHDELMTYFVSTFAPEIAHFAPAQPSHEVTAAPSPTWRGSSPSISSPRPQSVITAMANGVITEEAASVQPVSIRQGRGARLSFLGGRKKESATPTLTNGDHYGAGEVDSASVRSKSFDKDHSSNRRSILRSNGSDAPVLPSLPPVDTGDWITDSGGRRSSDLRTLSLSRTGTGSGKVERHEERSQASVSSGGNQALGLVKMGSVRKRFSMLKLGKKSSRGNGLMGAVDEE
ncbi:hypothetical protein HYQ44_004659 [Verticillium longisporum]|nr:hypothetical protein HYQ44_004659 [Verticillium longisporum]